MAFRPRETPHPLPNRPLEIAAFLDRHGWGEAAAEPCAADFSPRRYARLTLGDGRSAILMDADADQKTPIFVELAAALRKAGIDAPEIYAAQAQAGLVLMQDFGMRNIGMLLDAGSAARPYLLAGAGLLARLHRNWQTPPALDLPRFDADLFAAQAELFLDAYWPFARGREASDEERAGFRAAWLAALKPLDALPQSLLLRDFMPDNWMELAEGKIGVLDFQDAGIGPAAYDLASMCDEVRRDGAFALLPEIVAHYCTATAGAPARDEMLRACTILSAQRQTRILGVVARLAARGRREKLAFIPRIEKHLRNCLITDGLRPVREWVEKSGGLP